jgi:malonyl-CoA/methylmalonyl-CoA synthetase
LNDFFGEGRYRGLVCDKGAHFDGALVLKAPDGRLVKFKMPKRAIVVDELPRNAMGKVQKNILLNTYAKIYAK